MENDAEIEIKLNKERLERFHNPSLKEKYKEDEYLKLRLLTIELDNGQTEFLLTNLFDKTFDLDDFK